MQFIYTLSRPGFLSLLLYWFILLHPYSAQAFVAIKKTTFDFHPPLAGGLVLNGNYGEIRPNHFHAGLDLKTHPTKNLPIYSIADGYVSRIKISSTGYGKVLYITHPGGLVSVYAHQHHFSGNTAYYVKKSQYEKETFEIELFPKPTELPVKKGDIIGYTGNTGNSEGPHLHFEIRDEKSESPLNPLRFFSIEDHQAPQVNGIYFYDLNNSEQATITKSFSFTASKQKHSLLKQTGSHQKELLQPVLLNSCFGIGIAAFDTEATNGSKNQIFGTEVFLDGELYIQYEFDSIHFDKSRYVNCFTELNPAHKKEKIQRCFLSINEELPVFKHIQNNGEFMLKDTLVHTLKIRVYDIKKNEEIITLSVKRSAKIKDAVNPPFLRSCLNEWFKEADDYRILIPERSFFNNYHLLVQLQSGSKAYSSKVLFLKGTTTPLFKPIEIALKPAGIQEKLMNKLCLIETQSGNYCGGNPENGMIKGESKTLGTFALKADTIAPVIKHLSSKKNKQALSTTFLFQVNDNLSGLDSFRIEINGKWVLAEYDHKTKLISCSPDPQTSTRISSITCTACDKKENCSRVSVKLSN